MGAPLQFCGVVLLFGEVALPFPGVAHGVVGGGFGFPAEYVVGLGGLGPYLFDVAGSSFADYVRHFHSRGSLEGFDEFKHAEALARAEVEDFDGIGVGIVEHAFHGDYVSLGKVYHVDEVADATAVGGVVIGAEYGEFLPQSGSGLREERHKIVGHSVGEFADKGRRMGSYGVEVAEDDALDGSARSDIVGDNLLANLLGVSVGRSGRLNRSRLVDGIDIGFAVYGTRTRENDSLHVILRHEVQEIDEGCEIVAIVEQRFLHAFANSLRRREIDDTLDAFVGFEKVAQRVDVGAVAFHEIGTDARDFLYAVDYVAVGVGEVVDNHYIIASVLKFNHGMGAYVARAPGYEYSGFHESRVLGYTPSSWSLRNCSTVASRSAAKVTPNHFDGVWITLSVAVPSLIRSLTTVGM